MTMGLKIHRMMKDKDPPELQDDARRRKEVNDGVLDTIYNKLLDRKRVRIEKKHQKECDDDDL